MSKSFYPFNGSAFWRCYDLYYFASYYMSLLMYTHKQYLPDKAVAYTIISIFAVTIPFLLLKLSKMSPVESGESVGTDNNAQ